MSASNAQSRTDANALDRSAIVELTHRYCWAIDDRDWDALRSIFVPDATAFLGVDCRTVDAIVAQCRDFLSNLDASHHMVTNHIIDIDIDGGVATSRCYVQAQHTVRDLPGGDNWLLGGRYLDRLRSTVDGWRIERRELVTIWTDGNAGIVARASAGR